MVVARRKPRPEDESRVCDAILVVEDEVLVRMVIADDLRVAGYRVIEASNATEALDLVRCHGDVRLILSDVRMPGNMDGVTLAHKVRSEFPVIKIVLTSGGVTGSDCATLDGFFPKPYDAAQIIKHIKTLLDEELAYGATR